jgi:ATP-dependent Clp protease ATP-binding subunit ClpC
MLDQTFSYLKLNDHARRVMEHATREAQALRNESIGSEHILLGMMTEGTGVAVHALKYLGVGSEEICFVLTDITAVQPSPAASALSAKLIIDYAIDEARRFNHDYVGTEHLLLGMLRDTDGVAARVLVTLGVSLELAREVVLNLLGLSDVSGEPPATRRREPGPDTKHLPGYARDIAQAFGKLIDQLESGKEQLVADQDFDRAAALRDLEKRLVKYRTHFVKQWPKTDVKEV